MIRPDTLAYLVKRATESGLDPAVLGIEKPYESWTYDFAVIYGGALDESFEATTAYEVNIADWIAEMLRAESEADADHADWVVIVTREEFGAGNTIYRVSSES